MNLVRWNPFNEVMDLRNRIDRIFGDSFLPVFEGREDLSHSSWNPAVDIYEDDDAIVIKAELPGIDKDQITIDVKDRVLILKGERNSENEVEEENFYRRERVYGKFERAFTLPASIDPESVKANFKDGVLKIDVPKPEEQKPKQISIH